MVGFCHGGDMLASHDGYDDDDDDDFLKWKKHLGLKEVYSLVCPLDLKSLKFVQNSIFKS